MELSAKAMKNTERLGVDMSVAFSSEAKVLSSKTQAAPDRTSDLLRRGSGAHESGWRARLARKTQSAGRYFYGIAKPMLQPIAFRVRSFLTATLRQEMQQGQLAVIRKIDDQALKQQNRMEQALALHLQPLSQELASIKASLLRMPQGAASAVVCQAGEIQIRAGASARPDDVLAAAAALAVHGGLAVTVDFDQLPAQAHQAWRDALARAGLEARPRLQGAAPGTVLFASSGGAA